MYLKCFLNEKKLKKGLEMNPARSVLVEVAVGLALALAALFGAVNILKGVSFTINQNHVYPVEGFLKLVADESFRKHPPHSMAPREEPAIWYALSKEKGYVLGAVVTQGRGTWQIIGVNENSFRSKEAAEQELEKYISSDHYWWNPDEQLSSFLLPCVEDCLLLNP